MRKLMMAAAMAAGLLAATPQLANAYTGAYTGTAEAAGAATPAKIVLAKRLYAAMHMDKTMGGMMDQMMTSMIDGILKDHPEVSAADAEGLREAARETMQEFMPGILDKMVVVYAEELSEDELTQVVTFYESPVGQSLIAKLPQIMGKAMPLVMKDMPALQTNMQKKICAKTSLCKDDKAGKSKG